MDAAQYQLIVSAIAVSANPHLSSASDSAAASSLLDSFASSDIVALASTQLLSSDRPHVYGNQDVTPVVKLFSLLCLKNYVAKDYAKSDAAARLDFRNAVCTVCAKLTPEPNDTLIAPKLASLLADIVLNDFPQRWPSFFEDVLKVSDLSSGSQRLSLFSLSLSFSLSLLRSTKRLTLVGLSPSPPPPQLPPTMFSFFSALRPRRRPRAGCD